MISVLQLQDRHRELGLSDEDLLGMHRTILTARLLDQKIWSLNRMGRAAFVVSAQGHEGAQIGSAWAIRTGDGGDAVLPYYRDLGVVLALGVSPEEVLLGVFARGDDPSSGGRQMPNHWGSRERNIISGSSTVGTHLPHAVGIAAAYRHRREDRVAVCYFGDGAAARGDFHEALNYAGVHGLPVVFVCENNGYAISVPLAKGSAVDDIAQRAGSYGFGGVIVDGNDPLDVYAAVDDAVGRARAGDGPTLVECKIDRRLAEGGNGEWANDPLRRMERVVRERKLLTDAGLLELETDVRTEIDDAAIRAEAAVAAPSHHAFTKVYARPVQPLAGTPAGAGDEPALRVIPAPSPGGLRTVIEAVREIQRSLLEADDRVVILGHDVGPRGGVFRATEGLHAEFGDERVIDVPLGSVVGIGIGLALAGMRPIIEIQFADFVHSAFEQLASEAARLHYRSNGDFSVPLVVRVPWGGGLHGGLYHSQAVEALFAHVPGLKVVAPSTPADVAGLLRDAVDDPDPVIFLEHKKTYRLVKGPVPDDAGWRVPIGVAAIVRPGDDLTIVTYGMHRHLAVEAADALGEEGWSVEVIDLRTISPLDRHAVLTSARRTGRVLVVHEDNVSFGVGAEVAALVADEAFFDLDAPVRRLAMPDVPAMPFAAPLEAALSIDAARIRDAAWDLLET